MLCMERLARRINQAVIDGIWKPIKIAKGCPQLTHLLFTNDIILIIDASVSHVRIIH